LGQVLGQVLAQERVMVHNEVTGILIVKLMRILVMMITLVQRTKLIKKIPGQNGDRSY
ncbi:MAG: hypothetical protein ACI9IA_002402, partial [Enterobacterales bacterium]